MNVGSLNGRKPSLTAMPARPCSARMTTVIASATRYREPNQKP